MENQHVQVSSEDLAWLAGCIECDGSISIGYHNRTKTGIKPQCSVTFCNTGEIMFQRVLSIMKAIGVDGYMRELKTRKDKPQCKPLYQVELMNQSKCKKFLEAIYKYLLYKKPQADAVLEFINSRMAQHAQQGGKRVPFSKRELQLVYNIRILNKRGTSQTEDRDLVEAIASAQ